MKKRFLMISIIAIATMVLHSENSDWQDDSWDSQALLEMEKSNVIFKEMEIKNRSKKEYTDKVYKYIENKDYVVENNNIEIATVELSDDLRSSDVEVNVMTENLKVQGDAYRGDSIAIRKNDYKHFVKHDERGISQYNEIENKRVSSPKTIIETQDPLYQKVEDEDISELEVIDLREKPEIREVNVYIKDTTIRVGEDDENNK